jgi:hypothetical protein
MLPEEVGGDDSPSDGRILVSKLSFSPSTKRHESSGRSSRRREDPIVVRRRHSSTAGSHTSRRHGNVASGQEISGYDTWLHQIGEKVLRKCRVYSLE